MVGTLYGIGVGPGDPELMTLKAKRLLESSNVITYPVRATGERSRALEIVRSQVDVSSKTIQEVVFSMDPDLRVRESCRANAVKAIASTLEDGNDVAMVTIGDVSLYSTFMNISEAIEALGHPTEVVPGVPSFCGGGAAARIPLASGDEGLAVIPMVNGDELVGDALDRFENVVVMKAFNSMDRLSELMDEKGIPLDSCTVVSDIGLDDEYIGPMEPGREYGYLTTAIIKKGVEE